uniref:TATA box-binding protein-like 1 n=1 Tax=Lygus hesperus TaxID=30085 RepID=A0A0A9ZFM7_LYGHE
MNYVMAAVVQGTNGMKPLQNGSLGHLEVNQILPNNQDCSKSMPSVLQGNDQLVLQQQQMVSNAADQNPAEEPEIDIHINNVVCSFSVRCHLNLRQIALTGKHVEYRRENGMLTMKLRKPYTTASMWSSGKVTCTGATSEAASRVAARRFARTLQKLGFKCRFTNYRIVNVLGTCSMPFAIKITLFSERHREAEYEPELHPGVTYKLKNPKATLKIFSTGSITVTAPSVSDVQRAIETIYPLVYEFRKEKTKEDVEITPTDKKKLRNSTSDVEEDSEPDDLDD